MLPRWLYEAIPYLCMITGGAGVLALGNYATPLATVLYLYGAWIWVVRSNRRRRNLRARRGEVQRPWLNDFIYEALPFLYTLGGIYILALLQHPVRWVSGPPLILTGVLLVWVRARARRRFERELEPADKRRDPVDQLILSTQQARPAAPAARAGGGFGADVAQPECADAPGARCAICAVRDICGQSGLKDETVRELMRMSQSASPEEAWPLFRNAALKLEQREIPDEILRPIVRKLHAYAGLCASWRESGSF